MMKRVATVIFFANGNIAAWDEKGEPIEELQKKNCVDLFAEMAWSKGYNLSGCWVEVGSGRYIIDENGVRKWVQQ